MSKFSRFLGFILCSFLVIGTVQAQEKTVAGLYNDGLALLKEKNYKGGLALMEEALAKAGPDDEKVISLAKKNGAVAAYNVGNAERKAKAFDTAIEFYNKGIELNPDNSSNYEGVARAQEGKGNKVEAVKAYLKAAEMGVAEGKPDKAKKRSKKAETMVGKLFVGKEYDVAISAGEAFIGMKDDNAEVHYYLSRSFAESGNSEKAVEHATKAVSLSGDKADDKYHYAQATQLEAMGKKSEALAAYKKITGAKYKKQAAYKITELGG